MGTWIKETDQAIYLMEDNAYIASVIKRPSQTNPQEQVVDIKTVKSWFGRDDKPRRMTVAVGTGAPEPEPASSTPALPERPERPGDGTETVAPPNHSGAQLKVISDTYFKLSPKSSSELTDAQKVLVKKGSSFNIQSYTDVGNSHWLVELLEPTLGDQKTTGWYLYFPDTELVVDITLTVISDTYFKLEPKQSSELPATAKVFVSNATQLKLIHSLPAANQHTQVELAEATLGSGQETTWYVYTPDIQISGQQQTLETIGDTVFKASPAMSSELSADEKVLVKKKTVFLVNSYDQPEKNHVKVALQGAYLGPKKRNTWYCFVPDIKISGTEIGNRPDDSNSSSTGQPANPADRGMALTFPGFSGTYYANDPIYPQTQYGERGHFTWGESVHADPSTGYYRKPENSGIVYGILNVAKVMEDVRRRYGGVPIQVNSWYRDPATNAAVGGASQSRHMSGDAVDFVVPGKHPYDVYADLDAWWGNKGGLASSTVFTHIDTRGYNARWDYGY
jgi:hypothetical protein